MMLFSVFFLLGLELITGQHFSLARAVCQHLSHALGLHQACTFSLQGNVKNYKVTEKRLATRNKPLLHVQYFQKTVLPERQSPVTVREQFFAP
jgi:hypothetical protein